MTEIKNTNVYGLQESIKRSGYPMRWEEPERFGGYVAEPDPYGIQNAKWISDPILDMNDWKRAKNLCKAPLNSGHPNFLSGIVVQFDIRMPLYMLKQFQRYHFQQIISSSSSMHTITKRGDIRNDVNRYVDDKIIEIINDYITRYNWVNDKDDKYYYFMKIVSNLPSGFELWQGVTTNYLQLATIYQQRKNHKLKEDWGTFCQWVEELPYFKKLIIGENDE